MKYGLIKIIRFYQIMPSLSHNLCRFSPTCSEYTILCLEKFGVIKGLKLGAKRILKCRPGGKFGYDPVPNEEV